MQALFGRTIWHVSSGTKGKKPSWSWTGSCSILLRAGTRLRWWEHPGSEPQVGLRPRSELLRAALTFLNRPRCGWPCSLRGSYWGLEGLAVEPAANFTGRQGASLKPGRGRTSTSSCPKGELHVAAPATGRILHSRARHSENTRRSTATAAGRKLRVSGCQYKPLRHTGPRERRPRLAADRQGLRNRSTRC